MRDAPQKIVQEQSQAVESALPHADQCERGGVEIILGFDLDGKVRHFNNAALICLGFGVDELSRCTLEDLVDAEGLSALRYRHRRLLQNEVLQSAWKGAFRRKDTRLVPVEIRSQVVWYASQAIGFEVVGRDVAQFAADTLHNLALEEVAILFRMSEAVHQSLQIDCVLQAGLSVFSKLPFVAAAGVWLQVGECIDMALQAQVGGSINDSATLESAPMRNMLFAALGSQQVQMGRSAAATHDLVCVPLIADGVALGVVHLERSCDAPDTDRERQFLHALAGPFANAIARAQAHQALREIATLNEQCYHQAEEARCYLDKLLRSMPDVVLVGNDTLTCRALNPHRLTALVGYQPHEVAETPFLQLVSPEQREQFRSRWFAATGDHPQHFAIDLMHADQTRVQGMASAVRIAEQDEWLVLIKDVTLQRRFEEQVRQGEKMAALSRLVTGITHELNNPLAAILGLAQLQLMEDLPPLLRHDVERIERAALRIDHLIQQIRSFSRSQPLQIQRFEVAQLVLGNLARLQAEFAAHRIEVVTHVAADLPPMTGDPNQLSQALFNLFFHVLQVLQAVPDVTARRLTVQATIAGAMVCLSVSDTGPAIRSDHVVRVFDPFFTTRPVAQGTGFGLAIVQAIIRQHGGWVWVTSHCDQETAFHIELPLEQPNQADADGNA